MKFFKELLEEVHEKICDGAQKVYDLYDDNREEISATVDSIKDGIDKTKDFISEKTKESIQNLPETLEKTRKFVGEKLEAFGESYEEHNSLSNEELMRKNSVMAKGILSQRGYVKANGKWVRKGTRDIE